VGRLAGGVAHDFNNLLTTILGYCDLLVEERPSADLEEIQKAAQRAASLTHQLLAFSRKQPVQAVVLDVNAVTRELTGMLRRLIGEDVVLGTDLDPRPLHVRIDRAQLEQAIVNIAVNARDAMPRGGTLTVRSSTEWAAADPAGGAEAEYVVLEFRDTGRGMEREVLQRAFEPFFTTKSVGEGAGLGLSIVYGVAAQNGGRVELDSEPDRGTTVRLRLPLVAAAETAPRAEAAEPRGRAAARILVVEDESALRTMLRNLLRSRGYEVLEACDGEDALARLDGTAVDAVVTDVVMPRLSGPDLVEKLRAARPDLPVIYVSGYTEDRLLEEGALDENTRFLAKPFPLAALLTSLRQVLERAQRAESRDGRAALETEV
jgi:CheY-like chemotaxis protein